MVTPDIGSSRLRIARTPLLVVSAAPSPRHAKDRGSGTPILRLRVLCFRPFGFRLSENLLYNERKKIFRTFRRSACLPWAAGPSRGSALEAGFMAFHTLSFPWPAFRAGDLDMWKE